MKFFTFFKYKIKPIYIFLALLAVVLIVSALGSSKEGFFSSGVQTQMNALNAQKYDIITKIQVFVSSSKNTLWNTDNMFLTNFNNYIQKYKAFKQNIIPNLQSSQDKNSDGFIIENRNTHEFVRDNSGIEVFPSSSELIIASIGSTGGNGVTITQSIVDTAKDLINSQISLLSASDKTKINSLILSFMTITDKIITLVKSAESSSSGMSHTYDYDPDGILYRKKYDDYDDYDDDKKKRDDKKRRDKIKKDKIKKELDKIKRDKIKKELDKKKIKETNYGNGLGGSYGFNGGYGSVGDNSVINNNGGYSYDGGGSGNVSSIDDSNRNNNLGISKSNIPPGSEDLYILKSQIVPNNCPLNSSNSSSSDYNNPSVNGSGSNSFRPAAIPPCPPCERCPEPAFDCKKVPNYNNSMNNQLPQPVLADFSQFGM